MFATAGRRAFRPFAVMARASAGDCSSICALFGARSTGSMRRPGAGGPAAVVVPDVVTAGAVLKVDSDGPRLRRRRRRRRRHHEQSRPVHKHDVADGEEKEGGDEEEHEENADGQRAGVLGSSSATSLSGKAKNVLMAYAGLSKARLGALVLATTMVGYGAAPGPFDLATFALCSTGTALTVCSANAMNQWIEVDHDSKMLRTRRRALPLSRISERHALLFAATTGLGGTALLAATVNGLCAVLAAGNILLYAGVYTPLKRQHWLNTWVGAVVGAVPPVIGWVAATGRVEAGALALGAVLFVWQIPHFLALAWTYRLDYGRAGYQMFANNAQAARLTSVTFLWSLYHVALAPLCAYTGVTDWWFVLSSAPFTGHLMYRANQFLSRRTVHNSRLLFKSTLMWLPAALVLILFHKKRPLATSSDH